MFKNRNLIVIAVIAVVNALGYGIIIPILYTYSQKFGLSDFGNGLLFSIFSICQFVATPLIGRLSDKYGRKPLLLVSIIGTAISFLVMAWAPSAIWLFIARALDGITAGNIPVASAVISDTTAPQDRARGFGIIGASFGFGFIFGPAISALTLPWGLSVPFLIAAAVSFLAAILTLFVLPETNTHMGEIRSGKLFNFKHMTHAIFDKAIGKTLLIIFLYSSAFSLFIYAFQPVSVKILKLSAQQIAIFFTVAGLMGVIAQAGVIPRFTKRWGEKKALTGSLLVMVATFSGFFLARHFLLFIMLVIINSFANAFVLPLTQALLSKEVDAKSQGSILGLAASYQSIGMILGPILGGVIATVSVPMPFLLGAAFFVVCAFLSGKILIKPQPVQEVF